MNGALTILFLAATVPVFKGYESPRYQQHDAVIEKCVREFNRHRGAWADANRDQAKTIPDLTTELVKAHMIQETGGADGRSQAAWAKDPLQVNVPGDWHKEKALLGLKEPKSRNEGNLEKNVRAAIKYLVRKGFSTSGKPVRTVEAQEFWDWATALERYNGRAVKTVSGKPYCVEYADLIIKRAENHEAHVKIEIQTVPNAGNRGRQPLSR